MFDNFRIPRENLLNRTGDVTVDGEYESCFQNPEQILGKQSFMLKVGIEPSRECNSHQMIAFKRCF